MADSFVPVQPPVPQKVAAPGSTPGSEGADERPAAKRRKIALACNYCRARKTRCDGRQPACSTCEIKGASASCVYEQGTLKTQRYVSTLEARVQEYERRAIMESLDDRAGGQAVRQAALETSSRSDNSPMSHTQGDFTAVNRPAASPNHDTIATDAMVIVPSPEGDIDCLVGESSPIAFVRSMLRTIGKNYSPLRAANIKLGDDSPLDRAYLTPKKQDGDVDPVSLPTRRVPDALVKAFWEFLHPILPILHKPTFMKSYRVLWMGEDEVGQNGAADNREDPAFLSMLNIVFAIGCQFSDQVSPTRKSAIAKTFYQRSKKAFADDFLDTPTLSVVQLLLLTGVYLQSTVHANRCWNVVGSAIRTAQSLGLHLERTAESKNQLKREMERRVWHTCVFLDRQLAVTFGRPTMISARSRIPLPLIIDDEYLLEDSEGSQPSHLNAQVGSFVYSSKLFDILNEILSSFYVEKSTMFQPSSTPSSSYQELDTVMRLNGALNEFQEKLPSYLVISPDSANPKTPVDDKIALGAKILYSRFLYIRIFLLRPILLLVAQSSTNISPEKKLHSNESLEQQLALKACSLCVSTVQTLIAHIYKNMGSSYWTSISHKIHYAFSCAIVLVAARLCPIPEVDFGTASLQTSWSQCIEVFEHYVPHFPSASHVIRILEMLEQRVQYPSAEGNVASQRPQGPIASGTGPSGLACDSTWAMLDDLLQCEPMGQTFAGDMWSEEAMPNLSWTEFL